MQSHQQISDDDERLDDDKYHQNSWLSLLLQCVCCRCEGTKRKRSLLSANEEFQNASSILEETKLEDAAQPRGGADSSTAASPPTDTPATDNHPPSEVAQVTGSQDKRELSSGARLQRFMASKMAATTAGQDLLEQSIGEEEKKIIYWLLDLVAKYMDDEAALEMREHFTKLAAKIAVYYSDGQITDQEVNHMREVVLTLFQSFTSCANTVGMGKSGSKEREVDNLIIELKHFHTEAMKLIRHLMSTKNSQRLTTIVRFFANKDFLMQLFTSYDYKNNREQLKDIIVMLVSQGPIAAACEAKPPSA